MKNEIACQGQWSLLNDYADGRLTGRRRTAAELHLAACPACRGLLEEIGALRRLMAEQPPLPPDSFWEQCMPPQPAQALSRRSSRPRRWRPALGLALAAAAAGILAFFLRPAMMPPRDTSPAALVSEMPESEYMLEHARFAAAQALEGTCAHLPSASSVHALAGEESED